VDAPAFLSKETILELHELQIAFFGGELGLVNEGLLDSAIIAPINHFYYSSVTNLFDLSACYAFHLVKNHPFLDGNKRIALAAAFVFLKANGLPIKIRQSLIFKAVIDLATSKIDKHQFSNILRDHSPLEFAFMANLYSENDERKIKIRRGAIY
jgi:death on curing protein